jgi:ClpP class serine protease
MINPFVTMSKESEAKAQEMVNQMAVVFADEFKSKRGAKFKERFDYTTGEIWGGEEALAIGLIDEIGTIEGVGVMNGMPKHTILDQLTKPRDFFLSLEQKQLKKSWL